MFSVTYEVLKDEPFEVTKSPGLNNTPQPNKDFERKPTSSPIRENSQNQNLFQSESKIESQFARAKRMSSRKTSQLREAVRPDEEIKKDHFFADTFLNNLTANQVQTIDLNLYLKACQDNPDKDFIKKYIHWYLLKDQSHFMTNELENEVHFSCRKAIFSPTDDLMAIACYDNSLIIWDFEQSHLAKVPLKTHKAPITALCFSSNGSKIASINKANLLIVWDLVDLSQSNLMEIEGVKEIIKCMEFSPDNSKLALGSREGNLLVFDAKTGAPIMPPTPGHEAKVRSVAFSPDGTKIATGGQDKLILLWDVEKKTILKRLKGHRNEVLVARFTVMGDRLISGGRDKNVLIWDVEQGRELFDPMKGHKNAISALVISPDGLKFASGGRDKKIIFWDSSLGHIIAGPLEGHEQPIEHLKYSENGKKLMSVSKDNMVIIWDTIRNEIFKKPVDSYALASWVRSITPDGLTMVVANGKKDENDGTFTIWNSLTAQPISTCIKAHKDTIKAMACSPNNKLLVTGGRDRQVVVWNLEKTNEVLYGPLIGHKDEITAIAYSVDNKTFASGAKNAEIYVWDTFKGAPSAQDFNGHVGRITALAFCPQGRRLGSGGLDHKVNVWSVMHGTNQLSYSHDAAITAIAFDKDSGLVASGSEDGKIMVYEIEPEDKETEPRGIRAHLTGITALVFDHDGMKIASACKGTKDIIEVKIWDLTKKGLTLFIGPLHGHKYPIYSMTFSEDDSHLLSCSADCNKNWRISCVNSVKKHAIDSTFDVSNDGTRIVAPGEKNTDLLIYDSSTGKIKIHIMRSHMYKVNFAYFSFDSNKLISGSDDCSIMIWEADSGRPLLGPLKGHVAPVRVGVFSRSGHKLASSGTDKTVIIWDGQTGRALFEPLKGHSDHVYTMEFSSDDYRLVTGGDDGKIIVWDALSGNKMLEPIEAHEDWITCVKFLGDGSKIISTSFDTTIKIWNTGNGELSDTLQNHTQSVYSLKFSPDQNKMISASNDRKSIIFDSNSLCNCKFNRDRIFHTGVKNVHWSRTNDIFFVFDEEIQCYFDYFSNEALFFSRGLILSDFYRNPDKFSDEDLISIVNGTIGEIVPFYYTFLHVVAYTDDHQRFFQLRVLKLLKIKQKSIDFLAFFRKDIHNNSPVDIILKKNNKNLIQIVFKYIAKTYYPSQLYSQGFVDKITVSLLNQILSIFGEDTSLIIKLMDMCFDKPIDCPDLFVYKGFTKAFAKTLKEPKMTEHKLEHYIKENEKSRKKWYMPSSEEPFQTQEIIGAKALYLKDVLSLDKGDGLEFMRNLANLESDNPIFDNETFQRIVHYKWENYGRKIYFSEAGWFLALMLVYLFNAAYLMPLRVGFDHQDIYDSFALGLNALILFFNLRYAYREFSQLIAFGFFSYFVSVWNYMDILLIGAIMVSVTLDILSGIHYYTDFEDLKVIHAYIIFLLFIRLISYARGIKGTSFMIRLIQQVILDIRSFLFLMLMFILGLSYSTYMLQTDLTDNHFTTFNTFFREMLGDLTDYDEMVVDYTYALWVFFFIASIVLSVVLMNLLISIISDTFANVKANESLARHFEMCNIIYDIDAELDIKAPIQYYTFIYAETGHKEALTPIDLLKNKVQEATGLIKNIDYHLEMMLNKDGLAGYNAHLPDKKRNKH